MNRLCFATSQVGIPLRSLFVPGVDSARGGRGGNGSRRYSGKRRRALSLVLQLCRGCLLQRVALSGGE